MISELKISRREYITIEYDGGHYLILDKNKFLNISGKKIKVESKLPATITTLLNLLNDKSENNDNKPSNPAKQKTIEKKTTSTKSIKSKPNTSNIKDDFVKPGLIKEPVKSI